MREVCAATGLLGENISAVIPEPCWFVDFFTSYYTDVEPGAALVAEAKGRVVGYLLGCTNQRRYLRHQIMLSRAICLQSLIGLCTGEYGPLARRFLLWLLWRSWREVPRTPPGGAHFHFNILKQWRNYGRTNQMVNTFIHLLRREHPDLKIVWGQMETFGDRRSLRLFQRLGWDFYDRKKFSKYQYIFGPALPAHMKKINADRVYLTTIYRRI